MPSIHSEVRELIQAVLDHLEEHKGNSLLVSPDDCEEFRRWAQTGKPLKAAPPAPIVKIPEPKKVELTHHLPKIVPEAQKLEPTPEPIKTTTPPVRTAPAPAEEKIPLIEDSFSDLRKIWGKINPNAPLLDELPSDEIAKKLAVRWKTKNTVAAISILSYHEPPAQKALLEQIAKAINTLLEPAQIVQAEPIEKEKQWEVFLAAEPLKLTIACDYTLWQLGGLMQHYRENPTQKTRKLGSVPVFLLPDLSLYLKDPLLKRSLWKALCQTISS